MPTVEERISAVEGKMDAIADLKTLIGELRTDLNRIIGDMRSDMNRQFSKVRSDMDRRFTEVNRQVDTLDQRMERHFMWMVGIQFTVLIAVIVALIETSAR